LGLEQTDRRRCGRDQFLVRWRRAFILTETAGFANHALGRSAYPTLKGTTMSTSLRILAMSALFTGSVIVLAGAANAAPVGEPLAITKAVSNITQPVQWRGGGWGWGPAAIAGGIVGGAIVGGALAAPYGPGYYGPGYYGPPPPVAYGPPPGDAIAYCMQRFRSFDPSIGTYLGNDGNRHPCP
jgi:BA14K-like protein